MTGPCSVCDSHGVLVTWVQQGWAACPCPVCDPFVGNNVGGVVTVVAPFTGEVMVIKHGVLTEAPYWFCFGEDGG